MKSLSLLINEVYDITYQLGLCASPRDVFQTALQKIDPNDTRLITYDNEFKLLTYPIVERKVLHGCGIRNSNVYYWINNFNDPSLIGKKVEVKYDPLDINIAFVYINGCWKSLSPSIQPKRRGIDIYN
jgi:putative transposase